MALRIAQKNSANFAKKLIFFGAAGKKLKASYAIGAFVRRNFTPLIFVKNCR